MLDFRSSCKKFGRFQHNNLGGIGPSEGAEEVRWQEAGTLDGVPFDAVLTARTPFSRHPLQDVAICSVDNWAWILQSQYSNTLFNMAFQDSSTHVPVLLPSVKINFLDIDGGRNAVGDVYSYYVEVVTAHGFDGFILQPDAASAEACRAIEADLGAISPGRAAAGGGHGWLAEGERACCTFITVRYTHT